MNNFPTVAIAAIIVGAGIMLVDQLDGRAAWALSFLVLLTIALKYPSFGDEITKLLGGSVSNQQSNPNVDGPANSTNALTSSQNGTVAASY